MGNTFVYYGKPYSTDFTVMPVRLLIADDSIYPVLFRYTKLYGRTARTQPHFLSGGIRSRCVWRNFSSRICCTCRALLYRRNRYFILDYRLDFCSLRASEPSAQQHIQEAAEKTEPHRNERRRSCGLPAESY